MTGACVHSLHHNDEISLFCILGCTVQMQSQDSYTELKCKISPNLWYCKMFVCLFMQNVILHVKMEEDVHDI